MVKKIIPLFFIAALFYSCNSGSRDNPVTDTDVATAFIRAVLNNDLTTAEKFILNDDTNRQYFETFRRQYVQKDETELENFKKADIIINSLEPQNDSVTIINYSNSYKKDLKTNLKLIRNNGKWVVDFKYTIPENK
jgi:hypothetical protein